MDAHIVGELNADNNSAQENIGDFYVQQASPYRDVLIPFEFANPLPERVEMKLAVHGLVPGWTLTVDPGRFRLEPRERLEGEARLHADESVPVEDPARGRPAPVVSLEALVQIGCTWQSIGGFSMIGHAVREATLEAGVDPAATGVYVTTQARTPDGPIAGALVAVRLIDPSGHTLAVGREVTDQEGQTHQFLAADLTRFAPGVRLGAEARLAPGRGTGPASVRVAVPM